MAIEYNQNMKTTFNNYIDTAVSNLKKAGTEAGCILNFTFPSKTIIGRRFNKKSQISTLKENINSSYTTLSTIKSDVQKQVNAYKKANEAVMNITDSLDLSLTGAMGSLFGNLSKKDKQINNLNWAPSYMQGNQSNNANTDGFNWAASYQGGITPTGGYKGYSKYSFNDFWTDLKRTGATVINGFTALSEGATEMFFGGGDRAIELGGRAIASPYYALKDAWIYATSRGKKKGENLKNAWDSTMDFVADKSLVEKQHIAEHQQESYKEFDKYVYEPLKYGKSGYSIFKSLGGILGAATGPSVITGAPVITTAGISAKFIPTLSTGLTSGARGTSEYWQGKKSNSMQGIKDSYLLSEITEEQYKNIIGIRNISDEEWKKIEKSMTKKGIDKNSPEYQQYLEMKKIREIPKNWKNKETLFGGLKYGGATAAWEMAQFTIGGNLSDFVESPFARIAINTGLNSADPVVRASFMSQIDKTSFLKEFEKQGGIGAVLTSGAVGLLGSTIGEWAEYKARKSSIKRTEFYLVEQEDGSIRAEFNEPSNPHSRYIKTYMDHPANMTIEEAFETGNYAFEEDLVTIANYNKNRNTTSQFTQDIIDEDNIIDLEEIAPDKYGTSYKKNSIIDLEEIGSGKYAISSDKDDITYPLSKQSSKFNVETLNIKNDITIPPTVVTNLFSNGFLDTSAMMGENSIISKIMTGIKYNGKLNTIKTAKEQQMKYWDGLVDRDRIENVFEKIEVISEKEAKKRGIPDIVQGVRSEDDNIVVKKDALERYPNLVHHESNHSFGNLRRNPNIPNGLNKDRAWNEAATEMFSLDSVGLKWSNGISDYSSNVWQMRILRDAVNKVVQAIPGYEGKDYLKIIYPGFYTGSEDLIDIMLDEIMDQEGFTESIKALMEVADGGYFKQYSKEEIANAQDLLGKKVQEVKLKVFGEDEVTQELTPEMAPNFDVAKTIESANKSSRVLRETSDIDFQYWVGKINNDVVGNYSNNFAYLGNTFVQNLDDAIELTLRKQGREITIQLIKEYREAIRRGNFQCITRSYGARDFVEQYNKTEINSIDDAIDLTIKTYRNNNMSSIDEYRNYLRRQINEGNFNCITRDKGARQVVKDILQKATIFTPKENAIENITPINKKINNSVPKPIITDPNLNSFVQVFESDNKIKELLLKAAPPSYLYSQEGIIAYNDTLIKTIKDVKAQIEPMIKYMSRDIKKDINKKLNNIEKIIERTFNAEDLKKVYRDYFSDMSMNFVNDVGNVCLGYSLNSHRYNDGRSIDLYDVSNEAKSINEILHFVHSYICNNDRILSKMPILDEKNISKYGDKCTLYGLSNDIAREIYDNISEESKLGNTYVIGLEDKILMMIRDRGHALTIEIDIDKEKGTAFVKYFIPKICNIEKVNQLRGINKIPNNIKWRDTNARGMYETSLDGFGQDMVNFIKKVPTDSDMNDI